MSAREIPAFGLWYDFRNPAQWKRPFSTLYAEALDQIAWAESIGVDSVWLTEHHFCDDGYTPSPFVIASAIGQRTTRMKMGTNLIVSPLHNPVRLAEDAATLSLLTGGRFSLGVGQGYWIPEFEAFGRNIKHRPSLLEEGVEVIRRAWGDSTAPYDGRRFQLPGVSVTPKPEQIPDLLVGAMAPPAIARAAKIADGFLSTQNDHHPAYLEAVEALGKPAADAKIYAGQWTIIAEDPERVWADIGQHALYQLNEYIKWGAFGPPDEVPQFPDTDAILAAGAYQLWDADLAISNLTALLSERPQIKDVHFWAQLPGEPADSGSARIEYLAKKVAPGVRANLA